MKKISIAVIGVLAIAAAFFGAAALHNGQKTVSAEGNAVPEAAIVFLIDTSGSITTTQLNTVKNAFRAMVDTFPKNMDIHFGVVGFATNVTIVQPLTNNRELVKNRISTLSPGGNTNMLGGLVNARSVLNTYTGNGPKNIILFTDGYPTTGGTETQVRNEATSLKNADVTIFGVGFSSGVNVDFLGNIASKGQSYFSSDINTTSNTIANTISQAIMDMIVTVTFVQWDATNTVTVYKGTAATAPAISLRTGYTFTGWDADITNVTENITVTAMYTINTYTINFVDWNGETLKTQAVTYGSSATAPANPSRIGHTFTGWDIDFTSVAANLTVNALYTINSYNVTFVDWNNAILDAQIVDYDASAVAPANPSRVGYTFLGWDSEFSNISGDLTVTAVYSIDAYMVSFVDWDGELLDIQTVTYLEAATPPANPERAGHRFIGWDVEFDCITDDLTVTATYQTSFAGATASAYVIQIPGNKNQLVITVTEIYDDGTTASFTESFMIDNNAEGTYVVDKYLVYVDTKGNTQIRACYIVDFAYTDGLSYTLINNGTEYAVSMGNATAVNIVIPSTYKGLPVTMIGDKGFRDTKITKVTIPSSVTTLGRYAFYNCVGLTSVTIPSSVTTIGDFAFAYCTGLTSVTIPSSVTTLGRYAFHQTTSLTSVKIPNSITTISDFAFYNSGLTSIVIPSSVTTIGEFAFAYCTQAESVTIPSSVTTLGSYAFHQCVSLTTVKIPSSITTISDFAFYNAGLTSVTIPDSVTTIGDFAFAYCAGLTEVVIPNSVTTLGRYAFHQCVGLTSVYIPYSITTISDFAFYNCVSLTNVYIPSNVTTIGEFAFAYCTGLTNVSIPASVTTLGRYAFHQCVSLPSIILPNSITSIGEFAFYNCSSLTSIVIPNGVTAINEFTFAYCTNLTSVTVPSGVTHFGDYAFYKCVSLTDVEIPEGTTYIGSRAFSHCSALTGITIPRYVWRIGDYVFYGCNNLTIYVQITSASWDYTQYLWSPIWNYSNCPVIWVQIKAA